jgi:hypothetical protein
MDPATLCRLADHDLLLRGREQVIEVNRASAAMWQVMVEFHRRRERLQPKRREVRRQAVLTARQETVVEIGSLWGLGAPFVRQQLNLAICLATQLPGVWQLCLEGSLDPYRARLVADAVRDKLRRPEEVARFAPRITGFLRRHLTPVEGEPDSHPLVTCSAKQLRNRLYYEVRLLRSRDAEERFREKYVERRVTSREGEDGMGWLSVSATVDQVRLASHRLTLAARQKRAEGDERTLEQLRSDLAIDLLVGRAEDVPVPTYARPIVNVTVPIQTLMGIADHPGVLSGGVVIPAALTRKIARQPRSTWHRMLTDPAGRMVALSTKSYQPTAPIWRHVVAEHGTCFRPVCDQPATEAEADHRKEWPEGPTSTDNLWPGCPTDHRAKHTPGFGIEQDEDGSFVLRTRAGFRHRIQEAWSECGRPIPTRAGRPPRRSTTN